MTRIRDYHYLYSYANDQNQTSYFTDYIIILNKHMSECSNAGKPVKKNIR